MKAVGAESSAASIQGSLMMLVRLASFHRLLQLAKQASPMLIQRYHHHDCSILRRLPGIVRRSIAPLTHPLNTSLLSRYLASSKVS